MRGARSLADTGKNGSRAPPGPAARTEGPAGCKPRERVRSPPREVRPPSADLGVYETFFTASIAKSIATSSPSMALPLSRTLFQLTPKPFRLIVVVASKPMR